MSTRADNEFIEISTVVFQRISGPLPFDAYIKRAANVYTRIFLKGDEIDRERLAQYELGKCVQSLCVSKADYKQYLLYVESLANRSFNGGTELTPEEAAHIVKEIADLTMIELVVDLHVDERSVGHAVTTVKGCIDVLARDPRSLLRVIRLIATHPYALRHSVMASIFALLLARLEKLEGARTLTSVGLGALLHDIGMSQLPFDVEDRQTLKPEEWREVRTHPELGKRLLDGLKTVSSDVRSIVIQHHEQPNGRGYPNGVHDKQVYYLAKIVSISDSFSALVSRRSFREAMTPVQALATMNEDRGKFDGALLERFSKLFVSVR